MLVFIGKSFVDVFVAVELIEFLLFSATQHCDLIGSFRIMKLFKRISAVKGAVSLNSIIEVKVRTPRVVLTFSKSNQEDSQKTPTLSAK